MAWAGFWASGCSTAQLNEIMDLDNCLVNAVNVKWQWCLDSKLTYMLTKELTCKKGVTANLTDDRH